MQKDYEKLTEEKKYKFIVKNILNNIGFHAIHKKIKLLYGKNIFGITKNKYILESSTYFYNKIVIQLTQYKDNIIDYHTSSNIYYLNNAQKNRKTIKKILSYNLIVHPDENGFFIQDLINDTVNSITNIIEKELFSSLLL